MHALGRMFLRRLSALPNLQGRARCGGAPAICKRCISCQSPLSTSGALLALTALEKLRYNHPRRVLRISRIAS